MQSPRACAAARTVNNTAKTLKRVGWKESYADNVAHARILLLPPACPRTALPCTLSAVHTRSTLTAAPTASTMSADYADDMDSRPVFYIGQHESKRALDVSAELVQHAQDLGVRAASSLPAP